MKFRENILQNLVENPGFKHVFASQTHFWKNFGLFTRSLFWARNADFVIKVQFRHFREDIEFNVRTFRWIYPFSTFDWNIEEFISRICRTLSQNNFYSYFLNFLKILFLNLTYVVKVVIAIWIKDNI